MVSNQPTRGDDNSNSYPIKKDEEEIYYSTSDVVKALCYPILVDPDTNSNAKGQRLLTSKSKYVTRVSLKQFEESADLFYNKPIAWFIWLGAMETKNVTSLLSFYSARNTVMTFILENQSRRSNFLVDRFSGSSDKFGILPQRLTSTFEAIFQQSCFLSEGFSTFSNFLFGSTGVSSGNWKPMMQALAEIPSLIDKEIWGSVSKMIVLALGELSVTSSQNITAILLFISNLFHRFVTAGYEPRKTVELVDKFTMEFSRHLFDHTGGNFQESDQISYQKATVAFSMIPLHYLQNMDTYSNNLKSQNEQLM